MNGPFPLVPVIERIRDVPGVALVGNAADFEEAKTTSPRATPSVYVLSEEAGAGVLGSTGRTVQNVTVTLKLVMWVRNAGGAAAAVAAMAELEAALRAALFGWRPGPAFKPFTLRASGDEQAFGNHLVRQLLLTCHYPQTTEAQP